MKSSTHNPPPGQLPVGQAADEAPPAGNARRTTQIAKLAGLASCIADILVTILGCPPI